MKEPRPRGAAIDVHRMRNWTTEFVGYRHAVTELRIDRWVGQFLNGHRDLAARVLDCVDFIPYERISESFRSVLKSLPGWHSEESHRIGRWRFVAFSVSAGQSGDSMLHQFRIANGLTSGQHDNLFIHMRDLLRANLGPEDTVVFVDDFAGTGDQISEGWISNVAELLPERPNTYLILVAASIKARDAIREKTGMTVAPSIELDESDNIFSNLCERFDSEEKATLLEYCKKADRRHPKGYGDCGFVVVFAHRCPNNTIPILHTDHDTWIGLFRRHD